MSLFKELQRLYRPDRFQLEDFHTEIVAQVLRNSPALARDWLQGIGATNLSDATFSIQTQETFPALVGHATASRPDITVRLGLAGMSELIFIESKLPSTQGSDQLKRYREHLAAAAEKERLAKVSLVFITRDYEAAADEFLLDPQFRLTRWYVFYRYLKAHVNGDGLAKELQLFMEENRMSLGNQFRATDLVAMENFSSARALMDETLKGEVSSKASEVLGWVTSIKKASDELRVHNRYIVFREFNHHEVSCMIGYFFPKENPDESVMLGIDLQSNPGSERRKDVTAAFRGWAEKTNHSWVPYNSDDDSAWSGIRKLERLTSFMAGEDHVKAIKDYLKSLLDEVRHFKKEYPNLSWRPSGAEVESISEQ